MSVDLSSGAARNSVESINIVQFRQFIWPFRWHSCAGPLRAFAVGTRDKERLLNVVSGHGYVKIWFNVWLRCRIPFHAGPKRFGRTFYITCKKNKMPSSGRAIQKALPKPSLWKVGRAALRRASSDGAWQGRLSKCLAIDWQSSSMVQTILVLWIDWNACRQKKGINRNAWFQQKSMAWKWVADSFNSVVLSWVLAPLHAISGSCHALV